MAGVDPVNYLDAPPPPPREIVLFRILFPLIRKFQIRSDPDLLKLD